MMHPLMHPDELTHPPDATPPAAAGAEGQSPQSEPAFGNEGVQDSGMGPDERRSADSSRSAGAEQTQCTYDFAGVNALFNHRFPRYALDLVILW